jgi:hypothetical protein
VLEAEVVVVECVVVGDVVDCVVVEVVECVVVGDVESEVKVVVWEVVLEEDVVPVGNTNQLGRSGLNAVKTCMFGSGVRPLFGVPQF